MEINGLAKSMSGDMSNQEVEIIDWGEDLNWINGCEFTIINQESGKEEPKEYLCHSIVNYAAPEKLPWKLPTIGTDKRMFTLS